MLPYLLILVLGLAGMSAFQDRLLYFPEPAPREAVYAAAAQAGLQPWPAGEDYRGWRAEPTGAPRATLLLFHGNAGAAEDRAWYAEALRGLGVRLLLAEYPGYGARPGELGEESFARDAAATLRRVRAEFPGPLILAGESLGAGVAAAAHARAPEAAAALLLITPWDTLAAVARHHYPRLPVGLMLRDRYDSVANLAGWRGPAAVLIAAQDQIVPARHGRALYASLIGPKHLIEVPGLGHNDWSAGFDAAAWNRLLTLLLKEPAA